MPTSHVVSSPAMGFPKFSELPLELRLQIIEEAIAAHNPHAIRRGLTKFADIDSDWKQVVERILFSTIKISHKDLSNFGKICGKRQSLLKQLIFNIDVLEFPRGTLASLEELVVDCFRQLFHEMKDWSRADRAPSSLIKLHIHIAPWLTADPIWEQVTGLSCDFSNLPEVAVIGGLRASQHYDSRFRLNDSALISLHEKLPGLYNAKFELPCQALPQATINDASNRIITLHATKPGLTKLSIFHGRVDMFVKHQVEHGSRIAITKALTPLVSLWSNSLVCLKLDSIMDIAGFLLTASNSVWPHLHRLDLTGFLDHYNGHLDSAADSEDQASIDLLQGLILALPSMPKLTRLGVCFKDPNTWQRALFLSMDLNPRRNPEWHDWVPAYPYRAYLSKDPVVPCGSLSNSSACGTIKIQHVAWPGHLVTELLNTVWQQRQLDVAVFCCQEDPEMGFIEPGPCCTRWNNETLSWDPAFRNDMDVLIYDMGQYWLQTTPRQWGTRSDRPRW